MDSETIGEQVQLKQKKSSTNVEDFYISKFKILISEFYKCITSPYASATASMTASLMVG